MKIDRHLAFHTRRDAWVEINLSAIEHNVIAIKTFLQHANMALMAVIKADAYGHGAPMLVPILEGAEVAMLGVASVDEALQLKDTKTELPVLVLGPTPEWAMRFAAEAGFQISIFSERHLEVLKTAFEVNQRPTQVQIKVDTGMHRIGIPYTEAADFYETCLEASYIDVQGIFSHLADPANPQILGKQRQNWQTLLKQLPRLPKWYHLVSSSSLVPPILASPTTPVQRLTPPTPNNETSCNHIQDYISSLSEDNNIARVGLALFGYGDLADKIGLEPAMRLKARIVHLQVLEPGEGVSYGHTYINQTNQTQTIAALPLGYADGLPRGLSNHINALCHGQLTPQVGNICMDQCLVNVTPIPDVQVGDVMTLIGQDSELSIWLDNWADILQTIEYEMMTNLRVRLPRTYIRDNRF